MLNRHPVEGEAETCAGRGGRVSGREGKSIAAEAETNAGRCVRNGSFCPPPYRGAKLGIGRDVAFVISVRISTCRRQSYEKHCNRASPRCVFSCIRLSSALLGGTKESGCAARRHIRFPMFGARCGQRRHCSLHHSSTTRLK